MALVIKMAASHCWKNHPSEGFGITLITGVQCRSSADKKWSFRPTLQNWRAWPVCQDLSFDNDFDHIWSLCHVDGMISNQISFKNDCPWQSTIVEFCCQKSAPAVLLKRVVGWTWLKLCTQINHLHQGYNLLEGVNCTDWNSRLRQAFPSWDHPREAREFDSVCIRWGFKPLPSKSGLILAIALTPLNCQHFL